MPPKGAAPFAALRPVRAVPPLVEDVFFSGGPSEVFGPIVGPVAVPMGDVHGRLWCGAVVGLAYQPVNGLAFAVNGRFLVTVNGLLP